MNAHAAGRPTLCLLSCSPIADDPRVRRHGDAFHAAGWNVVAVGLPGARSAPPAWEIRHPSRISAPASSPPARARQMLRYLAVRARPQAALAIYWARSDVSGMWECAKDLSADVWLANDWTALPLAARLADRHRGIIGYDAHELATAEFEERPLWRLVKRPAIAAIERTFIARADVVTTVSRGIADELARDYRLARTPLVVMNVPAYQEHTFLPAGTPIRVLFHGLITPGRGLEQTIESVGRWRPEFTLTIRGQGEPDYVAHLRQRITAGGLESRVALVPPVPMTELIREAAAFDIGVHALVGDSRSNRFALPNKLFEYVMAGLAVCVSDLPEMARLVRQYGLGVVIPAPSADAIAAAVNALDRSAIDRYKQASLRAAKALCFESESRVLLEAYRDRLAAGAKAQAG